MTDMDLLHRHPPSKPKPRPRPQVMRLTEAAAQRVMELTKRADSEIVGLRVGIKNGGCAGQSYTVEYAHDVRPTDEVVEDKGVKILVDPKAVLFLLGTEMDYKADKMQAQFIFNNPNQISACGCGESRANDAGQDLKLAHCVTAHRDRDDAEAEPAMDRDFLIDLFADFGPVTIRRMFSGFGISADGTNFALALRGGLYLARRRTDHSAVRGGRLKAVSVSDPGQDGHRQFVLAAAGAAVRRSRGFDRLGEGVAGGSPARGIAQAAEAKKAAAGKVAKKAP